MLKSLVLGLLIDPRNRKIVLIEKNHPEILCGKWNGIGGKIEEGEQPIDALTREVFEETGISIKKQRGWQKNVNFLGTMGTKMGGIACFSWQGDISKATSREEEKVDIFDLDNLPKNLAPNLNDLIGTAIKRQVVASA